MRWSRRGICAASACCGSAAPATLAIRPFVDWPKALRDAVHGHVEIIGGGFNYDGRPITPLDPAEVRKAAREFRARGIEAVAISSVFAPVNTAQEQEAAAILQEELPDARIALSSQVGRIGLIERENAAIMNAALLPMAERVIDAFGRALHDLGAARAVLREPERRHAARSGSGRALSRVHLRLRADQQHARRAPISPARPRRWSWTSAARRPTSARWLSGFPRESSIAVDIGGVRTNFRMPDVLSIGLGGGSLVDDGERQGSRRAALGRLSHHRGGTGVRRQAAHRDRHRGRRRLCRRRRREPRRQARPEAGRGRRG